MRCMATSFHLAVGPVTKWAHKRGGMLCQKAQALKQDPRQGGLGVGAQSSFHDGRRDEPFTQGKKSLHGECIVWGGVPKLVHHIFVVGLHSGTRWLTVDASPGLHVNSSEPPGGTFVHTHPDFSAIQGRAVDQRLCKAGSEVS